ncbi:MAG: right-handed parallel beta-helix repeat-containing protein [Paludibacteraceae bacterium]
MVEGNTFSSQMTGILFEGDMEHWFESGAVNDVTIRNNTFLDGAYGGGAPHVTIWINPQLREIDPKNAYERNILIENNTFKTFNDGLLRAYSVENLTFVNNIIEESDTYEKWKTNP